MTLLVFPHCACFVCFRRIAGVADIEVLHHGIIRICDRRRVTPGVLCIEEHIFVCGLCQCIIVNARFFLEAVTDVCKALCFFIVFDRIRCTANAVCPPVIQIAAVNRCVFYFIADQVIQFCYGDHLQTDFLAVPLVECIDHWDNGRVRRCVIAEHAGHARDIKRIRIAVVLVFFDAFCQILVQHIHRIGFILLTEIHLRHVVGVFVIDNAECVAEVIVLAAPHQQTFSVFCFPEIRCLVFIKRIHAVMGMDIGEQKFNAVFDQDVACTHRNAVDVRVHCRIDGQSVCSEQVLHLFRFAGKRTTVH